MNITSLWQACVRPLRTAKGFFLVEISITLIITGTVLLVFMSAFSSSLKGIKKIRQMDAAAQISRTKMLEMMTLLRKSGDIAAQNGTAVIDNHSYGWEASFVPVEGTDNTLCLITITISEGENDILDFTTVIKK